MKVNIRIAENSDAKFVHDVYGYYVKHTNVTFTTENPTVAAYEEKIEHTLKRYPFYILEADGEACGFAYAGQIRPHEAYQWTAEGTVYLSPDAPKRKGLGRVFVPAAFGHITGNAHPNGVRCDHINERTKSSYAPEHGFLKKSGRFKRMGNKNGAWLDVVWMQKTLHTLANDATPPIPFSEL